MTNTSTNNSSNSDNNAAIIVNKRNAPKAGTAQIFCISDGNGAWNIGTDSVMSTHLPSCGAHDSTLDNEVSRSDH